jgi:hypothetical protein
VPLVAVLVGGGLIVVAALVAGAVFFRQIFGGGTATATPTATLTLSPPTASATVPSATATPPPTEGAATATLLPPSLELLEPGEGATVEPGMEVTFHWDVPEILRDSLSLVVMASHVTQGELCRSAHLSCTYTFDEEGTYEWSAELMRNGQRVAKSDSRTLSVRVPETPTPVPTTPAPPTPTGTPEPTDEGG